MNNPYVQPRFTRLSKSLSVGLAVLSLLTFLVPATKEYLALVPGRTLPCVWNLVTAGFVSSNPLKAAAEVAALLLLARSIEPVYGSTEFLRLVGVLDLSGALATFFSVYVYYLASSAKTGKVLYAQYSGFHGIIGGLLVALKQVMPDHEVKLLNVVKCKTRYFPTLYVLVVGALAAVTGAWTALPFLVYTPYMSWLYLRFFQQQPDTALKGDPSDDFAFSSFFPDALRPPIDALAGACSTLTRLRHVPGSAANGEASRLIGAGSGAIKSVGSAGADVTADSHRRRERGAKALEERLAAAKRAPVVDEETGGDAENP